MKSYTKTETGSRTKRTKSYASGGLHELFINELKDIYWAEKALIKALPKIIKNVTLRELTLSIQEHFQVTVQQVMRLENVFEILGLKADSKKCDAMDGLIKETENIIKSTEDGVVRDAGIISAAQKIEHYEIATYGTLKSFANVLGEYEAASLLEETLDEEKAADVKLTEIAESRINSEAAGLDDDEEDETEAGHDSETLDY
jgi:ferritin-like metal-binding protein YciE